MTMLIVSHKIKIKVIQKVRINKEKLVGLLQNEAIIGGLPSVLE